MEIGASSECFSICLQGIFLGFQQAEVTAETTEDILLFKLRLFGTAISLHNDYRTNYQYYLLYMIQHSKCARSSSVQNHKGILILNADDYGYNIHIDSGIIQLLTHRQIKSTSVIVNGANIDNATQMIHNFRQQQFEDYLDCSIGVHLNLTEGKPLNSKLIGTSLVENGCFLGKARFYAIIDQIDGSLVQQIAEQARFQILRFIKLFNRRPSHLDGHNHVHLVPKIAKAIAPVLRQMGIYRVRALQCTLSHITLEINHTFINNYQQAIKYYQQNYIIHPAGFVGLESFGNLQSQQLEAQLLRQKQKKYHYRSVQLMCHPGYPDQAGVPWIASSDRLKELQDLKSEEFNKMRKMVGHHSYLDLKDKDQDLGMSRVLIYSKLEKGCGNQTTTLRLECILQQMGFKVYLWNVVDTMDFQAQSQDLYKFLLNFGISLIIGVNATRSAAIIYQATIRLRVPFFLIIAGTDANITFEDKHALSKIQKALKSCQCLISLSQAMTAITQKTLDYLRTNKPIYTIVQSSCLSKVLLEQNCSGSWQQPSRPYILFPTSFRKVKCVHHVLAQLNHIIESYHYDVLIAGPILDEVYYAECVPQLGKIKYVGVLSKATYAKYLLGAALVINTSESEGMSCSILEAFQMKVAVIARKNPGNQQLLQHMSNGLLYSTPSEFLQMFELLKEDKELKCKLTSRSYQILGQKYGYEKELALYRQVIQKQFKDKIYEIEVQANRIKVFQQSEIHPISLPNLKLFQQIQHSFQPKSTLLDLGCGSGIFTLMVLSHAKELSNISLCLTDIQFPIVAQALYNLRQSTIWHRIDHVLLIESDMFEDIDKELQFDVILFNPPQSPFRQASSRPDKNGGQDALKYIIKGLSYISAHPRTTMYLLHSFMAWPQRFKQMLKTNSLKIEWKSNLELHKIPKQSYDSMETDLSVYILEHLQKGRAEIQYKDGVFIVPAVVYRLHTK